MKILIRLPIPTKLYSLKLTIFILLLVNGSANATPATAAIDSAIAPKSSSPPQLRATAASPISTAVCTNPVIGQMLNFTGTAWLCSYFGMITPQIFGATGSGLATSDDAPALNAWLAYLSANGKMGFWPEGTYVIKSCLRPVGGDNWGIMGSGSYTTVLKYAGIDATCDIMTIGNGTPKNRNSFSNFRIASTTQMSAGSALHLINQNYYSVDGVIFDGPNGTHSPGTFLWNGFWADHSSWGYLLNTAGYVSNNCVQMNDGVELNINNAQFIFCGGAAVLVGGGFGGLYTGYVGIFGAQIGIKVNRELSGVGNAQIFVSSHTAIDNSVVHGIHLNDEIDSSKSFTMQGWSSSTLNKGHGLVILNWKNGSINVSGASFINNQGCGIYFGDPSARLSIDGATTINYNGNWGVYAAIVTDNVFSDALPYNNASGTYSPSTHVEQLGPIGYRKQANGYIHQWGVVPGNPGADTQVNFPIAFPTALHSVSASMLATYTANIGATVSLGNQSRQSFVGQPRFFGAGGGVGRAGEPWTWQAWGN